MNVQHRTLNIQRRIMYSVNLKKEERSLRPIGHKTYAPVGEQHPQFVNRHSSFHEVLYDLNNKVKPLAA